MAEWLDEFLVRAVIAGFGVAAVTGPLGCFIVWRRIAYFGDTMAHSALLGVALGFLVGVNLIAGVVFVTVAIALLLVFLQGRPWLSSDTLLGILSHTALAAGVVATSAMPTLRIDLMGYLFGDILAVRSVDLLWIYAGGAVTLATLAALWNNLLAATLDEDLARAEGVRVGLTRLVFMLLIAIVIALAMKVVGILLITSLLIIPAATARRFARTPERMAMLAAAIGMAAVLLGLLGSFLGDTPSGPSIVLAAAVLFSASLPFGLADLPRN